MRLKITLSTPIQIDGLSTDTLVLREPIVDDSLQVHLLHPTNEDLREIALLARLADVSPEDLKRLSLRDLRRVQRAYLRLVASDEPADTGIVEVLA